jgi:hypothetical protein
MDRRRDQAQGLNLVQCGRRYLPPAEFNLSEPIHRARLLIQSVCGTEQHEHNVLNRGDFDLHFHAAGQPPRMIRDEGQTLFQILRDHNVIVSQLRPTIFITAWPHYNRGAPEDLTCIFVGCDQLADERACVLTGQRRLACTKRCESKHRRMVGAHVNQEFSSKPRLRDAP